MYGHKSQPSRIYSYKCKPPHEGAERVSEQIWLAHRYRNALIECERDRRNCVDAVLVQYYSDLTGLKKAWDERKKELDSRRDDVKSRNKQCRSRTANDDDREAIAEATRAVKEAYTEYADRRKIAFADPAVKVALEPIEVAHHERIRELRKQYSEMRGLYWGTYLTIEQARTGDRKGAPPEFRRWDGNGAVAVQIQGGLAWTDALLGTDKRLRITLESLESRPTVNKHGQPLPVADPNSRRSRERCRAVVSIRVGTAEDGRSPIWAKVLVHLHRHPSADSVIKWAYLRRLRSGCRECWSVQFVLARPEWTREGMPEAGRAGIDIGWRKFPDRVRVAVLVGDDSHREEVAISRDHLSMWEKADSLEAIRDREFNEARDGLATWLRGCAVPEWLADATGTLTQWRSQSRLAAVVIRWRDARFGGDEEMFATLEAWRKQDRHLWDWARALESKAIRRRDKMFRIFAARISHAYRAIMIEKMDVGKLRETPEVEENVPKTKATFYAKVASPGRLLQFLKEVVVEVIGKDPTNTTVACNACGAKNKFDAAKHVHFVCKECGERWDQDDNAAQNLCDDKPRAGDVGEAA